MRQQHPTPSTGSSAIPAPHGGLRLCLSTLALALSLGAAAQTAPAATTAQQRMQQELAACANGSSPQDPATCKREAINANAEARKGQLTAPQASTNPETQRCKELPEAQRSECLARMQSGTTSGSVAGGGILREHTTSVPAPATP